MFKIKLLSMTMFCLTSFCFKGYSKEYININKYSLTEMSDSLKIIIRDSLLNKYNCEKHFRIIQSLYNGQNRLDIKTDFKNDTLYEDEVITQLYVRPIVQNQVLLFFDNDKLIKELNLPIEKIRIKNYRSKYIRSLNSSIWKISIYRGKKQLYGVFGTGLTTGRYSAEFFGLYTMDGKKIYQSYHKKKTLSKSSKSLDLILKEYGISEKEFLKSNSIGKRIDFFWDNVPETILPK